MNNRSRSLIGLDKEGNRHWIGDFNSPLTLKAAVHEWLQKQYGACGIDEIEDGGSSQFKHPNSPHGYMTMDAFTCSPEMRIESMGDNNKIGPSPIWSGVG